MLEQYGEGSAKIKLEAIEAMSDRPRAKYVVVSAITPTPLGEGKTTTTVGLGQGFSHIDKLATIAIRQPSMGPTFGIKGGARRWWLLPGRSDGTIQPAPDRRHARRHRRTQPLLGPCSDSHLYFDNELGLDMANITWRRVLDVNDRALRSITIGQGGKLTASNAKPVSTSPPPPKSWPHLPSAPRYRTCGSASDASSSATRHLTPLSPPKKSALLVPWPSFSRKPSSRT